MSFGIYKPGQGYWTRVMSAIGIGMLGLSGASWGWKQLAVVNTSYEVIYLQAGVAGGFALLTGIFTYWLVGMNRRVNEFYIATEGELRKVAWPPRHELIGSTWVVIGISVIIAIILFISDLTFASLFRWIGVLKT